MQIHKTVNVAQEFPSRERQERVVAELRINSFCHVEFSSESEEFFDTRYNFRIPGISKKVEEKLCHERNETYKPTDE